MLYCFYIIPARAKSQLLLIFNPYTIPPIAISDMLPDTAIGYVRVFRRTAREKRIARARPLLYDTFMFSRLPFAYATGGLAVILTPFLFWWQESNALFYTLIAVVLVSVVSFVGLSTLSLSETLMRHIIFVLVSVAAGALIGDAFIHLVPGAFANMSNALLPSLLIILGILIFFVLEKFLHWHHEHGEQSVAAYRTYALGEEEKTSTPHAIHPVGKMILVSDGFHNFWMVLLSRSLSSRERKWESQRLSRSFSTKYRRRSEISAFSCMRDLRKHALFFSILYRRCALFWAPLSHFCWAALRRASRLSWCLSPRGIYLYRHRRPDSRASQDKKRARVVHSACGSTARSSCHDSPRIR